MIELYGLTPKEHEIVLLVALGLTNDEIGRALYRSTKTVKTHLRVAMRKLQVRNRVQVAYLTWEACRPELRSMLEEASA